MKSLKKYSLILVILIFSFDKWVLPELKKRFTGDKITTTAVDSAEVKIMTYNLENLFDTKDDPKKNDETYLPVSKKKDPKIRKKCMMAKKRHWQKECLKTNWTELKLDKKMLRISKVVNAYSPDLLFVQEVENIEVLNELNKKYLKFKNVILLESDDYRGIDVGILTNLNKTSKIKLHSLKSKKFRKKTRGLLEAKLELPDKTPLTVFALHLPSQGNPRSARENGLEILNKISKKRSGLKIAAGDFNITKQEESIYKKYTSDTYTVSHDMGCSSCKGSYYYHRKRAWSFFDVLLFSKNFKDSNWQVDLKSIDVFNSLSLQNTRYKTPARFYGGENQAGVSDHWPVVAKIVKKIN